MSTREQGNLGERIAESYLAGKGCRIIARNWRCRLGEIDLIVEDGADTVLVEVKTRWTDEFGSPEEAVNREKRSRLARLAEFYLSSGGIDGRPCRVDVIGIRMDEEKRTARVRHYRDILASQPY